MLSVPLRGGGGLSGLPSQVYVEPIPTILHKTRRVQICDGASSHVHATHQAFLLNHGIQLEGMTVGNPQSPVVLEDP